MRNRFVAASSLLIGLLYALLGVSVQAGVKLPAVFSEHMVLQQGVAVPVWGWADPGEKVQVAFAGQTKTTQAGADKKWLVKLDPLAATGRPGELTVQGTNRLTVADVLVGEVWLGSGQSNMAMQVSRALAPEQEQVAAKTPQIRMFRVDTHPATEAQADCSGKWVVCSPETVLQFSATAYFFGRELHKVLGQPVGLINSSVGGTPIESWIRPAAQQAAPELQAFFASQEKAAKEFDVEATKKRYEKELAKWKEVAAKAKQDGKAPPRRPRDPLEVRGRKGNVGGLYNGMIAPLIPYAIRGAIWYQGEANAHPSKSEFYQHQLPLLVRDWRAQWQQGDFPFAWVQLPNFARAGDYWPQVREAMLKSLAVPNTGMAIAIDIGDPQNIHPQNKQEVGRRLSLWALGTVYGKPGPTSGPLPDKHTIEGRRIVVSFRHAAGLIAKGGALEGFIIAGADRKWLPVQARIVGQTVIVEHPEVKQPVAVRYAWAENPRCNLVNGAGLPASPFRTDDWPPPAEK